MKNQVSISPFKYSSPVEMLAKDRNLDEPQDTEF